MLTSLLALKIIIVSYADSIVSTINPAISIDGSNAENAPRAQTKPHVCNKPYANVKDINMDLVEMIATCQRHTRCSPAYCLKKKKGVQECRFGYPKPLQPITTINMEGSTPMLMTQRNDCLINSYNPVQLSAWRANRDRRHAVHRVTKQGPQLHRQVRSQIGASVQGLEGSVRQHPEVNEG